MNFATSENRARICNEFNIQEKQFVEDVNFLKQWLLEQPHLPKIELNDNFIGNFLLRHKLSIERTKKALDMFFTIRKSFLELYENKHPKIISSEEYYDDNITLTLPKCVDTLKHVTFVTLSKERTYNPLLMLQKTVNLMEFKLQENFFIDEILVCDFKNFTLEDMLKYNLSLLTKAVKTYQNVYSVRTKSIYFINNKPYLNTIVNLLKSLIKDKIFKRIHFDVGYDSLQEALPKDMIPKDYGGDGPSLEELSKNCDLNLLKNSQFFDIIADIEVDEKLRPEELRSNAGDIFGMHGNFKQLSLD